MYFTKDHEWVSLDGNLATVGITAYAAEQLGDVVFIELPEVGTSLAPADQFAVVESVKAASEVYSPLAGEVAATNPAIVDDPALVNQDPQGEGWFIRLTLSDPSQVSSLMDEAGYRAYVEGLG